MSRKEPFAVQAAKFSLYAPIVAIVAVFISRAASVPQPFSMIVGVGAMLAYVLGFILGIVALVGMIKHGRKGILVRACLGVCFNGLILLCAAIAIPFLIRMRNEARKRKVASTAVPFSFTAPKGFVDYPAGKATMPDVLQSYIKGNPADAQPDIVILVEDLGGRIGKDDMAKHAKNIKGMKHFKEQWKTHQVDVFEIREQFGEVTTLTYNVQVPVLPKAIQLKVVGLASRQAEVLEALRGALKGVEGVTNW